MVLNLEFFIRLAFTIGGAWVVYSGISLAFIRGEELLKGAGLRIPAGLCVVVIGVIVIYFADFYPPLTKLLEPLVAAVFQLPKKLTNVIGGRQPIRLP